MTALAPRLYAAGLSASIPIRTHSNTKVLVSFTRRGVLRVHAGYERAPDEVIAAIARWARPRLRRADRRAAARVLTAFPVHEHAPSPRARRRVREPERPADRRVLDRLAVLHRELNARHFQGALGPVRFGLSTKMRRRLAEFRPAPMPGELAEISLSRRHLRSDGWAGVLETIAHEMVHQWQAETGRKLAHDPAFRRRCAELGIDGRAVKRFAHDILR